MTGSQHMKVALGGLALLPLLFLAGCSGGDSSRHGKDKSATEEEIKANREKLGQAERALAEEQEWCVVAADQRLGSMGVPYKVTVKGQTVFLCCDHCEKKALADPDKTLATLASHKQRAKERRGGKGM